MRGRPPYREPDVFLIRAKCGIITDVAVKVITDSVCDLPADIAEELDIEVVPMNVHFGDRAYRDGVDLTTADFYRMLEESRVFPTTSAPTPGAFVAAYERAAQDADAILVVTISSKLSATHEAALKAVDLLEARCPIRVLDSRVTTLAQGFVVMKAARAAASGADLEAASAEAERAIPRVDYLATFDTLEYLKRGGRIGAAQSLLGSVLKINPLVALRNGRVAPVGKARSRARAVDRLVDFAMGYTEIELVGVEHGACPDDAEDLVRRLRERVPDERIIRGSVGSTVGSHTGPGLLMVTVLGSAS